MMTSSAADQPDVGALSPEQQHKLRQFKIETRVNNEKYLRSHPEVEMLVGDFLREVFVKRPDDIPQFAAEYFTRADLSSTIRSREQKTRADTQ